MSLNFSKPFSAASGQVSKILSETLVTGHGNAGVSEPIFSRAFLIFSHIDVPDSLILAQDFQNF